MENQFIIGFYVLLGFYLIYRFFRNSNKPHAREEINDILTSDKYKVKGQYEE